MLSFFTNRRKYKLPAKQIKDPVLYDMEKTIAQGNDVKKRIHLAGASKTHQEILYYLAAKDPDPRVRQAVAENSGTPIHASAVLARDPDIDVRMSIAKRLIMLLPALSHDKQSQLYAFAVQALGDLALDEVLKIRIALSSALKDHAHTPPKVAGQLARDLERDVSEPILKFCTALADDDLLDILSQHPAGWVIEAVAGRKSVSANISGALIDSNHVPAGEILLKNKGAQLSDILIEDMIQKARHFPEWQKPLATRKSLPPLMAKELASFAEDAVKDLLLLRSDFDSETRHEITDTFKRRMEYAEIQAHTSESASARAARLAQEGKLNEEIISDALGMRDKEFVMAAIAQLTGYSPIEITKIFDMQAPKSIIALTWKAGLSMRLALRFQQELGKVPTKELIYPKQGKNFPLSAEDMNWQLEFLGFPV